MTLWDFIATKLLPLFGEIPDDVLLDVQKLFWGFLGLCVCHFLVLVPYRGLLALMRYKRWGAVK